MDKAWCYFTVAGHNRKCGEYLHRGYLEKVPLSDIWAGIAQRNRMDFKTFKEQTDISPPG